MTRSRTVVVADIQAEERDSYDLPLLPHYNSDRLQPDRPRTRSGHVATSRTAVGGGRTALRAPWDCEVESAGTDEAAETAGLEAVVAVLA
jgi:hypothetical protein